MWPARWASAMAVSFRVVSSGMVVTSSPAGTRSSQVTSRRKEVERLQTTELARSNIQRPYIKFPMARPSGRMAIEINTAGWSLPAQEAYPAFELLSGARQRGIPLLINADAHRPEHLTHDFARARDLARCAGYTELVRYQARKTLCTDLT